MPIPTNCSSTSNILRNWVRAVNFVRMLVGKTQDCFIQLLQREIFFCHQTFQTVYQLHRDHTFKQVVEDVRQKSCNGMEIGEMIRENTTLFYTIILHSFICLYFLNQGIMGIFSSPFKTTGHSIWFLHFCLGGKAESAEICSPETLTETSEPMGCKVISHNRADCAFETVTKCFNVDTQVFLDQPREVQKPSHIQTVVHHLHCTKGPAE